MRLPCRGRAAADLIYAEMASYSPALGQPVATAPPRPRAAAHPTPAGRAGLGCHGMGGDWPLDLPRPAWAAMAELRCPGRDPDRVEALEEARGAAAGNAGRDAWLGGLGEAGSLHLPLGHGEDPAVHSGPRLTLGTRDWTATQRSLIRPLLRPTARLRNIMRSVI